MNTDPQKEYEHLVSIMLKSEGVSASQMFGMPCLKTAKGKAFAGYFKGELTLKLPQSVIQPWLGQPGARLFDPGMGRSMKEWLQLSADHAEQWPELAAEALAFVNTKS